MPPEGAPLSLRDRITAGRRAIVSELADVLRPGPDADGASPDPELTARMLSALADEAARLILTDPAGYPVTRIMANARWMLGQAGR